MTDTFRGILIQINYGPMLRRQFEYDIIHFDSSSCPGCQSYSLGELFRKER